MDTVGIPSPRRRAARPPLDDDVPREECGVLGISTPHGDGVAQLAFFGLFALQHRGQEAAGIAVSDGHRMFEVPVSARLHEYDMESLYATDVLREVEDAQPLRRREQQPRPWSEAA